MGKAGHGTAVPTLSASEFARRAGVSRERLRTWERRFDFPSPIRTGSGPRRYPRTDLSLVIAVRRASEQGVPLPAAIAAARGGEARAALDDSAVRTAAECLPAPLMLLSGPEPVQVEWANAWLSDFPRAPKAGDRVDELRWYSGSPLADAVEALFAGRAETLEVEHPDWGGRGERVASLAYRLPASTLGSPVLVALAELQAADRQELAALRAEAGAASRRRRWLTMLGHLAEIFRDEPDPQLIVRATEAIVEGVGARDVGIGVYMGGEIALGSSAGGMLGPVMVTVAAHPELAALVRGRDPGWLPRTTAVAFGAPPEVAMAAVSIRVGAEPLGALLFVFDEPEEIDEEVRAMLSAASAGVGFALLRDRLT